MGGHTGAEDEVTPWDEQVFVIGEAGVNHNGSLEMAMALVDAVADAGCNAVKFQAFSADLLAAPGAPLARYQQESGAVASDQREMLAGLELPATAYPKLAARALERGVRFLCTAFDEVSMDQLLAMSLPVWKIPSGEISNYPALVRIARLGLPTIVSTGMCSMAEVSAAVDLLAAQGLDRRLICVLQCNTQYPTPFSDVNLLAMPTMGRALGVAVGYSDHTPGIEISIAATAIGARVIEKHVTLDRKLPGPDHAASLEPGELAQMVASIRHVEAALGSSIKRVTQSEAPNRTVARKSIVAAVAIRAGETFSEHNLATKRPGTGIDPMRWPDLIGCTAHRDYAKDELISW